MKYNFDEIIDRRNTNSLSYDGWKPYLFNLPRDEAFPYPDHDYVRMWVADMDFATPPEILDAIRARLDDRILGYTCLYDQSYYTVLESWFLKRYNWQIDVEELVTAPGVVPALNRLTGLLTGPGERILITTPSYAPFKKAGDYHEREVVTSDLLLRSGQFGMDFEDIAEKLADKRLNIRLFILCNPHNPTGRVWTREELLSLGELCLQNDVWIISDEIHCDLLRRGRTHTPLSALFPASDRIITCTAPSKTFNLAGNMMSHLFIKNEAVRAAYKKQFHEMLSPLSIVAARAAYASCEPWLEALVTYLDDNFSYLQQWLQNTLPLARFAVPEATYLAWIDLSAYLRLLPDPRNPALFFAREAGLLIEDGNFFVGNGTGYIRLNIACPRAVLEEGLRRMGAALERYT